LDRCADPTWTDHKRKSLSEIPQHLERDTAGTKYDCCSELDNRNISRRQRCADLLATHEMLRLWVMSKPTEIDDASEARDRSSPPESHSQLVVTSAKVFSTQRVHEIERGLASS
jgi:hypothetical protein